MSMQLQSACLADTETLMNAPLPTRDIHIVLWVTLLSVACAFGSG